MQNYKANNFSIYIFKEFRRKSVFPALFFLAFLIIPLVFSSCLQREKVLSNQSESRKLVRPQAVNLNTASSAELEKLPRIGKVTAHKIIDFREKYGGFQRIEEIMLIEKMSEKHFREIRDSITVD